jgi:hypothetical protein
MQPYDTFIKCDEEPFFTAKPSAWEVPTRVHQKCG